MTTKKTLTVRVPGWQHPSVRVKSLSPLLVFQIITGAVRSPVLGGGTGQRLRARVRYHGVGQAEPTKAFSALGGAQLEADWREREIKYKCVDEQQAQSPTGMVTGQYHNHITFNLNAKH